jgi:hypothetical protein
MTGIESQPCAGACRSTPEVRWNGIRILAGAQRFGRKGVLEAARVERQPIFAAQAKT